jgi:hypothetical protein
LARRPSLRDVKDLCLLYKVDKPTADEFWALAREAREREWWTQFEDLKLDPYLGLEQVASAITSYTMYYVPALLQTEEYSRVIIETIAPRMDPKILQQRIEVRMRRQERLNEADRPRYRVLLDEAVLYRSVGGPAVMAAQLDKILEVERKNKVTFQIVPFNLGAHAAQDSNFILFEFNEKSGLPPVAFVEALTGNHYLEKEGDIDRYREAAEYLRDTSLNPRDSVQRLTEIKKTYMPDRHPTSVGAASKGETHSMSAPARFRNFHRNPHQIICRQPVRSRLWQRRRGRSSTAAIPGLTFQLQGRLYSPRRPKFIKQSMHRNTDIHRQDRGDAQTSA